LSADRRHQRVFDAALVMMHRWMGANRDLLIAKFGEFSRYTPQFIDAYIVDRLIAGAADIIEQVATHPEHELRAKFDASVLQFVHDLEHSERLRAQADTIKRELIAHFKANESYRVWWRFAREKIQGDLTRSPSIIRTHLTQVLLAFGTALGKDPALQKSLDRKIERAVELIAVRNRHEISLLIEEIVRGWDATDMAQKAELEIGRDLQYIRINGMVVGGLVGLALHALSRLW
jgi:uncharacterized membrane-anchored protein YjiN (DUF445 family)